MTAPLLAKAVRLTEAVMRAAAVPRERIAGVFLVGGASRMPLAATTLHRSTGIAPTVLDHPELVVATGATLAVPAQPKQPPPHDMRRGSGAGGGSGTSWMGGGGVTGAKVGPATGARTALKALHWL